MLFSAPRYRGPVSDHFDGRRFRNPSGDSPHGFRELFRWLAHRERGEWRKWTDAPPGPPPPRSVADLRVTFVNHATTLVQTSGVNVLTDPVWSERVSPVSFAGPKRVRPPGIRFEDLPPIDAVLVSHNHYDHLDVPTLRALQSRFRCRILTPLGNAALMARYGIDAEDLDWWERKGMTTLVQAQHFCARGLSDRNTTLWGGFVIHGRGGNVYFAGDTGWGDHFAKIGDLFAPIRLALLPIGSYLPRWFMRPAHIDPEEAVDAHHKLGASTSLAIHYGTWELGDDGEFDPVDDLRRAIAANGNPRFWIMEHGEGREVPRSAGRATG